MGASVTGDNPLADGSARGWTRAVDAAGPASLLVVIGSRMGAALRRRTTAEDVLQDVLMEAWARRASVQWRGAQAFRSWLLTLIDHRLADTADHFAARKRGGPGIGSGGEHNTGESGAPVEAQVTTTPSRLAAYREQAATMSAALGTIPDECREVVRLRLFDELQSSEIAARLGIGESAVRHRFRRGVEVYRKALERLLSSRTRREPESARTGRGDSAPESG